MNDGEALLRYRCAGSVSANVMVASSPCWGVLYVGKAVVTCVGCVWCEVRCEDPRKAVEIATDLHVP